MSPEGYRAEMSDPRSRLFEMLFGFTVTQALGAAVRLGIPDLVADRPRTAHELARAVGADPDALSRLIRTLAGSGVFTERDGVVMHTPMSELLRTDADGSMAAQCRYATTIQYRTWGDSFESFRTGAPAFPRVYGNPMFDWLAEHPAEAATFDAAMAAGSVHRTARLVSRDWSAAATVVDVGGGTAGTLIRILEAHPHLRGTVVDLPHVQAGALTAIEAAGLTDRCTFTPGDFFDAVPSGADAYVLSAILHDWDDAAAEEILRTVRAAMPAAARLVLAEHVVRPGNERDEAKLLDLHMLVALGGRERSEGQWRALLGRTGFEPAMVETGLVEATPA
jgi:hypothetical protein